MHYLYLIVLSFLLVACQPSTPSEIDVYQKHQAQANQTLEEQFTQTISQHIEQAKSSPLETSNVALSNQAATALKSTLDQLESAHSEDSNAVSSPLQSSPRQNGALLLHVRDYQATYQHIHQLATDYDFTIIKETEQTNDFHKKSVMEIQTSSNNFATLIKEFRELAAIIRKKQIWLQTDNKDFLALQGQIISTQKQLEDLKTALTSNTSVEETLSIKDKIATATQQLDLAVLKAQNILNNTPQSTILLSFYQDIEPTKPKPRAFSADFSTNLIIGWKNFKQFILDTALIWPYLILALIFITTIGLAVSNSRKKARQFQLQLLHNQNLQQQKIQQQLTQNKMNNN